MLLGKAVAVSVGEALARMDGIPVALVIDVLP